MGKHENKLKTMIFIVNSISEYINEFCVVYTGCNMRASGFWKLESEL